MENCIQKAMANQSLTAAELSRRSGVAYGTIYDISIGKTKVEKMAVEKFLKICRALGMTAEELYYGTPPSEKRSRGDPIFDRVAEQYATLNKRGRLRVADVMDDIASNGANLKSSGTEDGGEAVPEIREVGSAS